MADPLPAGASEALAGSSASSGAGSVAPASAVPEAAPKVFKDIPQALRRFWCIWWDPCGLACFSFGVATTFFINYVTLIHVIWPWMPLRTLPGAVHTVVFESLVVMTLWSYFRASMTDPGSVQQNTATEMDVFPPADDEERIWKPKRRYCSKCQCIKPPRAHHCSTCGRCVNKMDHHCPWINNCVGSNNMKHFLQFIVWTFVGTSYAAVISIWRAVQCWRSPRLCMPFPSTWVLIAFAASTVLAIFFAIFVAAMGCDQHEGMVTNTTGVEALKGWDEEDRSVGEGLRDACGESCGWRWLVPVALRRTSPTYYAWQPTDNPDAYDPRDPAIRKHFARIEAVVAEGKQPRPPPTPEEYMLQLQQRKEAEKKAGKAGRAKGGEEACEHGHSHSHGHSHGDHEEEEEDEEEDGTEYDPAKAEAEAAAISAAAPKPVLSMKSAAASAPAPSAAVAAAKPAGESPPSKGSGKAASSSTVRQRKNARG